MPKRRVRRVRRNRRAASSNASSTTKVSTGIPQFIRRLRADPPPLKLSSSNAVRVSFNITFNVGSASQPFTVSVASTPFTSNYVYIRPSNTEATHTFYLDQDEIFAAASIMAHGSIPDAGTSIAVATEYCIQSVSFYGPPATSIRLGVDFGPGLPGAHVGDEASGTSRPAVRVVNPRLYWFRRGAVSATDAVMWGSINGYRPLGESVNRGSASANTFLYAAGRLDFTVMIRRSYFNQNVALLSAKVKETLPA